MRQKWIAFTRELSVSEKLAQESYEQMDQLYTEAHRAYHNWQHIAEMLHWLEKLIPELGQN